MKEKLSEISIFSFKVFVAEGHQTFYSKKYYLKFPEAWFGLLKLFPIITFSDHKNYLKVTRGGVTGKEMSNFFTIKKCDICYIFHGVWLKIGLH